MFADPEPNVAAARIVTGEIARVFDVIHGRAVEIGAAAHEQRDRLSDRLQGFTAGFARGQLCILGELWNFR